MSHSKTALNGLAQHLAYEGLMPEDMVHQALKQAHDQQITFISYLIQNKLLQPAMLAEAVAKNLELPLLDLSPYDASLIPADLMSEQLISKHRMLPLVIRDKRLDLAVADPTNHKAIEEIQFYTGLSINTIIVEADKLASLVDSVLNVQAEARLEDFSKNLEDSVTTETEEAIQASGNKTPQDTTIIKYVHKILVDAIHQKASDIHFEPYDNIYRIRFRIDGILYQAAMPPLSLASRITSRLKVMSQLDISERRLPQDGRFKIKLTPKHTIDFRISTCPTVHGEKIVIRVLDSDSNALDITKLGFEPLQQEIFAKTIQLPYGMILVTGPTGSGKTVTLYTALSQLNTIERNICTVEDPVEINLRGINQVNINLKTNLTFSTVLRSFLRQNPDIIMVGEIRDLETAEIGVKAAQTGHLVLSTLHTNNAPEALTRLRNMGVASFNIASSVALIIAQRLARKLCKACKQEDQLTTQVLLKQGFLANELSDLKIYKASRGCKYCNKGYKGRTGVFELLSISPTLSEVIMDNGSTQAIIQQARKEGFQTLYESGLQKVRQGITSLEEIHRIILM